MCSFCLELGIHYWVPTVPNPSANANPTDFVCSTFFRWVWTGVFQKPCTLLSNELILNSTMSHRYFKAFKKHSLNQNFFFSWLHMTKGEKVGYGNSLRKAWLFSFVANSYWPCLGLENTSHLKWLISNLNFFLEVPCFTRNYTKSSTS